MAIRVLAYKRNSISTNSDTAHLTNGTLVDIETTVSFVASPSITALSIRKPASAGISLGGHAGLLHQLPITTTCFFSSNQQTDDATVLNEKQSFAKSKEKSLK